jgi:glycosyltransferase involved in cell wall biosynthesis
MDDNGTKPTVDVLLGTFNGEKYLAEFLDSVLKQEFVDLKLIVSDDGSTDSTLSILNQYRSKFNIFTLVSGPKEGAARNYLSLSKLSSSEFVAFADQDDIWDANHLINSINRISKEGKTPGLSYCAMREFDDASGITRRIWPARDAVLNLNSILLQNYARGCTIVMNRSAANLLNSVFPERLLMHDWWALLIVFTHGTVKFGSQPEITYRLHDANQIGIPSRFSSKLNFLIQLLKGKWAPFGQALDLKEHFGMTMKEQDLLSLDTLLALKKFSFNSSVNFAFHRPQYKSENIDNFGLTVATFLIPIAVRNWK